MPIGNTKKLDSNLSSEKDDLIKLDIVHIDNITSSKKEDPTADVAEKFHPSIRELFNHSPPRNETRKQRLNRESKEAVQELLTMYTKDPCSVKNPITLNNVTLFPGHVYPVTNLVFIKKYSIIVSASNDKTMRFYNSKTGDVLNVVANTNGTPSSCVYYNPLDVAAIVTYSGTIEFMDIKAGHLAGRMRLNQAIHSVAVDPYTDILFVGTRKGHVYGFRLSVNHCQNRPRLDPLYDEGQVQDCCYCFAPDNSFAYRIDSDVHPITTGAHSAPVTSITPISGFLFTGDDYGKILQWDLESSQLIRKFHSHNDTITSVTVTGDGFMISSSKDALIIIWSIADGSVLRRINRHYHHVIGVFLGFLECVNFPYECGENKKMESKLRNTHKDDTVCTNNTIEKGRLENQTLQKSCNNQLMTTLNQKDENTHIISSPTKVSPVHSRSQLSGYHLDNDHSATVSVTSRNCVYSRENITLSSDRLLMISISEDESVVTWSVNYRS